MYVSVLYCFQNGCSGWGLMEWGGLVCFVVTSYTLLFSIFSFKKTHFCFFFPEVIKKELNKFMN
uniref:Uncharacterized protein n=1 Tax=Anguilla anguilla TaxID=7936 RepID=A0A0E9RNI2_ANGAN